MGLVIDAAGVIKAASNPGKYDMVIASYNIINSAFPEESIRYAREKGWRSYAKI